MFFEKEMNGPSKFHYRSKKIHINIVAGGKVTGLRTGSQRQERAQTNFSGVLLMSGRQFPCLFAEAHMCGISGLTHGVRQTAVCTSNRKGTIRKESALIKKRL